MVGVLSRQTVLKGPLLLTKVFDSGGSILYFIELKNMTPTYEAIRTNNRDMLLVCTARKRLKTRLFQESFLKHLSLHSMQVPHYH